MRVLQALKPEVELRSEVGGWKAIRCPFHDDRAASASYNPTSERFRCHGCGMSGDGFDLIMEVERCDFASALNRAQMLCGQEFKAISPGIVSTSQRSRLTSRKNSQRSKLIRSRKRR